MLRRARKAQRDFERTRRASLPADLDAGSHSCDERVGRYCYWYEPFDESALRESKSVERARERLLRELVAARERFPEDGWITGQLVRYLVEQGLVDSAVVTAQQCQATRWWCDALEGFTRHMARDYEGADSAFGRAVRAMPDSLRCTWTDLTLLLGDRGKPYRDLPCTDRQSADERIWWLARPLYSHPGNDLRTEYYARHTMALLLDDTEPSDGIRWGADTRELGLRFGWPTRWSLAFDRLGRAAPPNIIGYEPSPSFWLFPAPVIAEPWADVTELEWDLGMEHPPARYAPPYARGFAPIERVQFARFRRHDTTLTVAAFDLTPDSLFATRPADVRLAVALDPATLPVFERTPIPGSRGIVTVRSPWRPAVLSLEATGVDTPWVARQRVMTPPDPIELPPAVSDILLFAPAEAPPESLEAALPAALSAPAVPRGQSVGLYWEIYEQPDSAAPTEITVTATKASSKSDAPYPVGRPWCPLPTQSIRLAWSEEPGAGPRGMGRAVTLDLRSLPEDRYVITVQVRVAGRTLGCSSRELQVIAR